LRLLGIADLEPEGSRFSILFAESETRFFLKVVEAEVELFMDPSGAFTYLVIHQGGRDTNAIKNQV
jgi:hypothetical protein